MKALLVIICIIFSFLAISPWVTAGIWSVWWYPKTYEASLNLADDASTPELKVKYLREYRSQVATIKGEPRYFFKRPNWNTKVQLEILDSLIKRFDDLTKINPSEMAYQQGMFQLTGQEVEHQMKDISQIFKAAKWRESQPFFYFCLWGGLLFWITPTIAIIFTVSIWNELDQRRMGL